jgi:hypothetical protein
MALIILQILFCLPFGIAEFGLLHEILFQAVTASFFLPFAACPNFAFLDNPKSI